MGQTLSLGTDEQDRHSPLLLKWGMRNLTGATHKYKTYIRNVQDAKTKQKGRDLICQQFLQAESKGFEVRKNWILILASLVSK